MRFHGNDGRSMRGSLQTWIPYAQWIQKACLDPGCALWGFSPNNLAYHLNFAAFRPVVILSPTRCLCSRSGPGGNVKPFLVRPNKQFYVIWHYFQPTIQIYDIKVTLQNVKCSLFIVLKHCLLWQRLRPLTHLTGHYSVCVTYFW